MKTILILILVSMTIAASNEVGGWKLILPTCREQWVVVDGKPVRTEWCEAIREIVTDTTKADSARGKK